MADTKISGLTALTGANVAATDAFPIVDTSATETKKIDASELKTYMFNSAAVALTVGNITGTAGGNPWVSLTDGAVSLKSAAQILWSANASATSTKDLFLDRLAAAVLRLRGASSAPATFSLSTYTVAGLPSAVTVGAGAMAFVSDASATTARSTVAGGGANFVMVMCNGTDWLIVA